MDAEKDYLNSAEATTLLGVKKQTLYAYVSRGIVRSFPGQGTRARVYAREDLERAHLRALSQSGQEAVAASALDLGHPIFPTSITEITSRGARYRGHLAVDLVDRGIGFEQVAELLWTGRLPVLAAHVLYQRQDLVDLLRPLATTAQDVEQRLRPGVPSRVKWVVKPCELCTRKGGSVSFLNHC